MLRKKKKILVREGIQKKNLLIFGHDGGSNTKIQIVRGTFFCLDFDAFPGGRRGLTWIQNFWGNFFLLPKTHIFFNIFLFGHILRGWWLDSNPKLVRHYFCLNSDIINFFFLALFGIKEKFLISIQENRGEGGGSGQFLQYPNMSRFLFRIPSFSPICSKPISHSCFSWKDLWWSPTPDHKS